MTPFSSKKMKAPIMYKEWVLPFLEGRGHEILKKVSCQKNYALLLLRGFGKLLVTVKKTSL